MLCCKLTKLTKFALFTSTLFKYLIGSTILAQRSRIYIRFFDSGSTEDLYHYEKHYILNEKKKNKCFFL